MAEGSDYVDQAIDTSYERPDHMLQLCGNNLARECIDAPPRFP